MQYAIATLVLFVPSILYSGYVFSTIWSWFIVTTFGLPELSLTSALGVAAVVGYLKAKPRDFTVEELSSEAHFTRFLVVGLLYPTLAFGYSWVVKQFM